MNRANPLGNLKKEHKAALVACAVLLGIGIYHFAKIDILSSQISDLSSHIAVLDQRLASTTETLGQFTGSTTEKFNKQDASLAQVEQKVGIYRQEIGNVSSKVVTLQKLSQTDPELLAKYSKVFFLNENYAPPRLKEIPESYKFSATKAVSVHADIWTHLQAMMDDARREGVNLLVSSGYRSFSEQKNLKSDYRVTYGTGTANQFSADQGYSEHQLGTTVDFTTAGLNGALEGFEKTPAYKWLVANAHRSGFVLSYPENNDFYIFEPWHWRYVGVKLATDLHSRGKHFYDLDQREIDSHLVNIFE